MSDPAEEIKYNTESLSPVSPKPVHYHYTASIPVLENQMDPIFNDTESHKEQANPTGLDDPESKAAADTAAAPTPAGGQMMQNDSVDIETNGVVEPVTTDVASDDGQQMATVEGVAEDTNQMYISSSGGAHVDEIDSVDASALAAAAPVTDDVASSTHQPTDTSPAEDPTNDDGDRTSEVLPSPLTSLPAGVSLPARPPAQVTLPTPSASTVPLDASLHDSLSEQPIPIESAPAPYAPLANAATPPPLTAGAPGTILASPNEQPPQSITSLSQIAAPVSETVGPKEDENIKWGSDTQQAYDEFLEEERKFVLIGRWEDFPLGSRLFVGNLSSDLVTKRDLFHVFHKYGKLAQLSIKSSFGFVQFLNPNDARKALQHEQDVSVRGRNIHLEASNPSRNIKNATGNRDGRRRSPSPMRRQGRADEFARYSDRRPRPESSSNSRQMSQDTWRPTRSRSPSRRNAWSPNGYRQRSSPLPSAYRPPSASGLPIPWRTGMAIPELQILVKGPVDRMFVDYVKLIAGKKLRVSDMYLGDRLDLQEVMQRQGMEGVLGVMIISPMQVQSLQNFAVTIIDYSLGNGRVGFEDYTYKSLEICVALVVQAKQKRIQSQTPMQRYPGPNAFPMPPARGPSPLPYHQNYNNYPGPSVSGSVPPASSMAGMDPLSLQALLAKVQGSSSTPQTPQQPQYSAFGNQNQNQQYPQPNMPPTPASRHNFLDAWAPPASGFGQPPPTPSQTMYHPQQTQVPQPAGQNPTDFHKIMAQLGSWKDSSMP